MIRIDKSRFTADELAAYDALIAKAKVDPEAAQDETMDEEMPEFMRKRPAKKADEELEKECKTKKSADPSPELMALQAMQARIDAIEKAAEMKECSEIAKRYAAALGEDEAKLAQTLYDMRKSDNGNYDAYVGVLEKGLAMVEKSGLFAEIGKSARGAVPETAMGKAEAYAAQLMKSDPTTTYEQAIAKAWQDNPELMLDYENERGK